MEFLPLVALAFTVMTVINFLKYLRAQDWNGAFTLLAVWGAGVGSLLLFAQSQWADTITFGPLSGDVPLSKLNFASLVILGLQVGSTASTTVEFKKAIDQSDSAAKPNLITDDPPDA